MLTNRRLLTRAFNKAAQDNIARQRSIPGRVQQRPFLFFKYEIDGKNKENKPYKVVHPELFIFKNNQSKSSKNEY